MWESLKIEALKLYICFKISCYKFNWIVLIYKQYIDMYSWNLRGVKLSINVYKFLLAYISFNIGTKISKFKSSDKKVGTL